LFVGTLGKICDFTFIQIYNKRNSNQMKIWGSRENIKKKTLLHAQVAIKIGLAQQHILFRIFS
jgi:hypothetical protein